MNSFPIVLEPEGLSEIEKLTPPSPTSPRRPIEPKEHKEMLFGVLWCLLCVCGFFIMLATDSIDGSGMLIPGMFISSLFLMLIQNYVNSSISKNYNAALVKYKQELTKYGEGLQAYEKDLAILNEASSIEEFRYGKRKQVFRKALRLTMTDVRPKKGRSENGFVGELLKYFPGKIITKKAVGYNAWEAETHYQPDFILVEPTSQLHIDIEIDEPYIMGTKTPIHFIGCTKDSERNSYFQRNGWYVIRFSEEQIIKYPKECSKFISDTIYSITGNPEYLDRVKGVNAQLPKTRRWTREEAKDLAEKNYRANYLFAASTEAGDKTLEEELKENGFNRWSNKITSVEQMEKLNAILRKHGVR